MTQSTYFLAIDNGTQSIRAMIFDQQGALVAKSKVDIEPYFSNQNGLGGAEARLFLVVSVSGLPETLAFVRLP